MKLDTKQQVLLALYIEYQKDIPKMGSVNCTELNMDIEVFNAALMKLETEGYITGLFTLAADNDMFCTVSTDNVRLMRDGVELVENKFGIKKELTAKDKVSYIARKCGVLGFTALKAVALAAIEILK